MNTLLQVEAALTEDERMQIRTWWDRLNPRLAGAPVADIIDMLWEHDSYVRFIDVWWDAESPLLVEHSPALISQMAYAVLVLHEAHWEYLTPEQVAERLTPEVTRRLAEVES